MFSKKSVEKVKNRMMAEPQPQPKPNPTFRTFGHGCDSCFIHLDMDDGRKRLISHSEAVHILNAYYDADTCAKFICADCPHITDFDAAITGVAMLYEYEKLKQANKKKATIRNAT
jgi:hypothetical protein